MKSGIVLTARAIAKHFGTRPVLEDVSFDVRAGEVTALLGPNGSGKTTLLSILVGLLKSERGTVDTAPGRPGWVPQGAAVYRRLTIRENLALFAGLLRIPGDRPTMIATAAAEAGLADRLGDPCWSLSGGLRQRLSVAIGLLGDPTLILLDEPATGIDLAHRRDMWRMIRGRAQRGSGVLLSTHSLHDAGMSDRVLVLTGGTIVYDGALAGVGATDAPDAIEAGLLAMWERATP